MTIGSIGGYTEATQGRYLLASNKEKGRILDESTKVIGCHSRGAIRLARTTSHSRDWVPAPCAGATTQNDWVTGAAGVELPG